MSARYDVVVVGCGHAGIEAALAAARMGAKVGAVTLHRSTVGQMPCNPAIGGIGKGHLVAELDALGGVQGWAADRTGLHFRRLNASRGPAVWGPRAQCDKEKYSIVMRRLLERVPGIDLVEGEVDDLLVDDRGVGGVRLVGGRALMSRTTVVTTGTFLRGVLHTGEEKRAGGRFGERASVGLGRALAGLGLVLRRFKTGTPPRIHRDSVRYEDLEQQRGDASPQPFSWRSRSVRNRALCWIARTTEAAQSIIEENLERSPLYSGRIEGVGPRYCPSIEDKVVRFPHHRQHTVFLEPETLDGPSMYLNGLSTSLPRDIQERVVRSVPGLEQRPVLALWIRRRVRRRGATASRPQPGGDRVFAGCIWRARCSARPDTKKRQRWDLLPVSMRRRAPATQKGCDQGGRVAYIGVMIDDLVSPRSRRAVPDVHVSRRAPFADWGSTPPASGSWGKESGWGWFQKRCFTWNVDAGSDKSGLSRISMGRRSTLIVRLLRACAKSPVWIFGDRPRGAGCCDVTMSMVW